MYTVQIAGHVTIQVTILYRSLWSLWCISDITGECINDSTSTCIGVCTGSHCTEVTVQVIVQVTDYTSDK